MDKIYKKFILKPIWNPTQQNSAMGQSCDFEKITIENHHVINFNYNNNEPNSKFTHIFINLFYKLILFLERYNI